MDGERRTPFNGAARVRGDGMHRLKRRTQGAPAPTPSVRRHVRRRAALCALPAVLALAGCGTAAIPAAHPATTVGIVLQDFKISAGATRLAAGKVTFVVANNGPSTHEFNVDRTSLAGDALPIDSTGVSVDQSSPSLQRQGSVESAGLGTTRRLTLDLKAGHYVFYCDLPGHYMSGMRVSVDVY
jgi:uncharacterized cupredoxin-like copper-binding protein